MIVLHLSYMHMKQDCHPQDLQIDAYASFEGQIQQLLFNGEQWGLWNIRSTSDTLFLGELQRYM